MISTTCVNSFSVFQCPCASHSVNPGKRGVITSSTKFLHSIALITPFGRLVPKYNVSRSCTSTRWPHAASTNASTNALRLITMNPPLHRGRYVLAKPREHAIGIGVDDGGIAHVRPDERLGNRAVEELHERSVIAGGVEEAARLGVHAELRPRPDLEDLFERAEAAGERDEAVGEIGHRRLALVHRLDDANLRQ